MDNQMKLFVEVTCDILEVVTPVVEVGSVQITEGIFGDLRPYFPKPYVGLDMDLGPGVDLVGNVESLPLKDESVGTLVSVSTLEHVENPISAFDEMHRVIDKTGIIIVTSVFNFPIHAYPNDYWRFTPECFNLLLNKCNHRIIFYLGPAENPDLHFRIEWVMGIGFKTDGKEDTRYYEAKAKLLHENYLLQLSQLTTTSLKTGLLKKIRMLPGSGLFRAFSQAGLGTELHTVLYCGESRYSIFRDRLA